MGSSGKVSTLSASVATGDSVGDSVGEEVGETVGSEVVATGATGASVGEVVGGSVMLHSSIHISLQYAETVSPGLPTIAESHCPSSRAMSSQVTVL